ncbi:MAG: MoxR family ATPase [Candidatus Hydrogenedentota bacterium]
MNQPAVVANESSIEQAHEIIEALIDNIETVMYGKREVIQLCIVGLLARGHLLIEDIPGIGKTTLAQALALSIDCDFNRVQFTSDMLPADILGVSIINPSTREFDFRKGPVFANIVLADEINRTPPKTQSALLEAMSESHVTTDGITRQLPSPFMVLATQNPIEYEGTYTLPEAQLDRFLLRISIGYPGGDDELRIMRRHDPQPLLDAIKPNLTGSDVKTLQAISQQIRIEDSVAAYMLAIVQATREHPDIRLGASPRASLALYESCQAYALVQGRDYVTPGDVKTLAPPVMCHRIIAKSHGGNRVATTHEREMVMKEILNTVPVPA